MSENTTTTGQFRQFGQAIGHIEVIAESLEDTITKIRERKAQIAAEIRNFCAESSAPSEYQWVNAK